MVIIQNTILLTVPASIDNFNLFYNYHLLPFITIYYYSFSNIKLFYAMDLIGHY